MDGEGVTDGFVEGALPKFGIGICVPTESFGGELPLFFFPSLVWEPEETDLLVGEGREGVCANGRSEGTLIGVHDGLDVEGALVKGEEGDVVEGVVFAETCAAEVGELSKALSNGKLCGFGQIVVFLFGNGVEKVGVACAVLSGQGVAIANDGIGCMTTVDVGLGCAVTANDMGGVLQDGTCHGVGGIVASGENHAVIIFFHLKYPNIAMMM